MSNLIIDTRQGHWLLSKMGKRVLRPGGKELTLKLLEGMKFSPEDQVVEFAPGIGYTASKVLQKHPKSYTGIELNQEAAAYLKRKINGQNRQIIIADASHTTLAASCADKVYGEAMLTMHVDRRKAEIISEAARILKPGGYYGIHELGLTPDSIDEKTKATIQRELSMSIKVNARPLTKEEWICLLQGQGFKIIQVYTNSMLLLETRRIIDDEGLLRSFRIGYNILRDASARKRILEMKKVFTKYKTSMNAVAIVAQKI